MTEKQATVAKQLENCMGGSPNCRSCPYHVGGCEQALCEDVFDEFIHPLIHATQVTEETVANVETVEAVDMVNHPGHYTAGGIECIDAIAASMTPEEFRGYCKGNCLKYLWRYAHKNGLEDLKKADWYLHKLISTLEGTH